MTREYLKNYRHYKEWVDEQLEDYNERMERVMHLSQHITGLPKAKGNTSYELEKIIDDFKDILNMVHEEQKRLNAVLIQLNKLKPLYRNILYKRYVEGKRLEQVATEVGYSYNRTCSFNGYALNEFDKLDEEEKSSKKTKLIKNDKIC